MKKGFKKIFAAIIALVMVVASLESVSAVSKSIHLGNATKTDSYIAGVSFNYKKKNDGTYVYCLNRHKNVAQNIKANLVENSKYVDGGVAYILRNGYPNKSITGEKSKDYYITQTAVWWYLDKAKGMSNLGSDFKKNGSDKHNLRKYVKALMEDGYNHRNDSRASSVNYNLAVTASDTNMVLKDSYYVSSDIKISSSSNDEKKIKLEGAPEGTKIVKSDGSEMNYSGEFKLKNETFKVKVAASSLSDTSKSITVKVTGLEKMEYTANEYQPTDSKMQNVALFESDTKSGTKDVVLQISTSKVSITKVDAKTNQPLAGAGLVLKDSTGKVLAEWTSTVNAHIIGNLSNGTYTVEETVAPTGYIAKEGAVTFTISDTNKSVEVVVENTPKKAVVNIVKVDQETNSPLAGAELVVRNSQGSEVARFVTTEQAYVLTDLENGTYTVEEVSAPSGYIKSNEKITFTIDDDHLSHQVTFINAKAVPVPDTATMPSGILIIIGLIVTLSGIYYISGNARKVK